MNNLKNDEYYIGKILTDLHFIVEHMEGVTIRTLGENEVLLDSMSFRLIQIQENAKKLTEASSGIDNSKVQRGLDLRNAAIRIKGKCREYYKYLSKGGKSKPKKTY